MNRYRVSVSVASLLLALSACSPQAAITTAKNFAGDTIKNTVTDKVNSTLGVNDYSGCWTSSDKVSTIKMVIAKGNGPGVYSFSGSETPADGSAVQAQEGTFKEITDTEVELTYTKPLAMTLKAKVTGTPKDKLFEFEALSASGGTTAGTRTSYRSCP